MLTITKRLVTTDVRSRILLSSLNGKMSDALVLLRQQQQTSVDVELLHTMLARAAALAHADTIAYMWYQHVMPRRLPVEGRLLCEMAGVALYQDRLFLPAQFLQHYQAMNRDRRTSPEDELIEYELRRIKVEAFARGTMHSTALREKWKVFLQEMDTLPGQPPLRLRDFPQMTKAMGIALAQQDEQAAALALFGRQPLVIKNEWSLPLLLAGVLWHVPGPAQARRVLAEFRQSYRGLPLLDAELVIKRRGFEINT
ncbi:AEL_collapsed_G0023480.mRNA.1.CDS.1 [Saccharomyces cerevisiae]|nr:AEL_collapsed_G0023480.mRNA.1.CDS.1 [Saccharomyces cerevisiae]